jgi:hypothetical protein
VNGVPERDGGADIAARMGRDFRRWLVVWGAYTREFWGYPCFPVPRGTIVHSPDPDEAASTMTAIEMSASYLAAPVLRSAPVPASSSGRGPVPRETGPLKDGPQAVGQSRAIRGERSEVR